MVSVWPQWWQTVGGPRDKIWDFVQPCSAQWRVLRGLESMVSCQKGPTCHAYAWQIEPCWLDTLVIRFAVVKVSSAMIILYFMFIACRQHIGILCHLILPSDVNYGIRDIICNNIPVILAVFFISPTIRCPSDVWHIDIQSSIKIPLFVIEAQCVHW